MLKVEVVVKKTSIGLAKDERSQMVNRGKPSIVSEQLIRNGSKIDEKIFKIACRITCLIFINSI